MKWEGSMTTQTRQRYTEEFKAEAVRLIRDSARPVAHVARDLGIADHVLYRWRAEQQQAESHGNTRQSMRAEQDGLARLRHTYASRLAMSNVTEVTIASLRWHSGTTLVRC